MRELERVYFMIEGGRALELVKRHVAEARRVTEGVLEIATELDASQIWRDRETGVLRAVLFKGNAHPDFTKPNRHGSHPKKGTEWARRFDAQRGYDCPSYLIADAFEIPLTIEYEHANGHGSRLIAIPYAECGFLLSDAAGPYAMWIPDVEAAVADDRAQGYEVDDHAGSFKAEFEGCRRIAFEEWEILKLQSRLDKKKAVSVAALAGES
ncbi:hypothetical protein [Burkholderia cenocepacia]|uniref:hypothetical protein n=1 Tax=Burkholderia cenocepacia TaxID=95486 RepID=UPI001B9E3D2A|nr:hypothetical protein [Burkholderia cenocepacia]MBR8426198.1 hypothetical protein [Burkholderia cenocepacia]